MATIKDLNNAYSKENTFLSKLTAPGGLKDKIEQFQQDLDLNIKDFKVKEAEMQYALSRNDKTTADALKKDLEILSKDILALRGKLEKASSFLANQQKVVDEKFDDLSKDPEVKQKLDSILYKKYDRKKKQEFDKKQQLETIKQIVDTHPTVKSWFKGIEGYEKSIRKCDKVIEKYKDVVCIEVDKTEFRYFNDNSLISATSNNIGNFVREHNNKPVIIVDINNSSVAEGLCDKVIYLLEPSTIKLNKLITLKPSALRDLKNKNVVSL